MSVSKQAILSIIKNREIPIKSVSSDAVEFINGIMDRYLAALFPADSSLVLENVIKRDNVVFNDSGFSKELQDIPEDPGVFEVPLETVKKMIRSHAGNYTVPTDTLKLISSCISEYTSQIITDVIQSNELQTKYNLRTPIDLTGELLVDFFMNTEEGKQSSLHKPPIGPLTKKMKSKAKKSRSRKSRSRKSRSKKRCASGKKAVIGFVRKDGVRVKAYCRKSKSRK
jgi:hypothetical protein